jgi:hypothetical protein
VAALKDPRNLVFIVVVVETHRASDVHFLTLKILRLYIFKYYNQEHNSLAMLTYRHTASLLKEILEQRKGFKTAFYDYYERNKSAIGTQMNRLYSMGINVYKRSEDIARVIEELFGDHQIKDRYMLMVLVHEGVIMDEKLKIGGKLSTMVKQNKAELQTRLGKAEKTEA